MEVKESLFKLRWDNQGSLLGSVASLFREEAFVDTTIFTDGKSFRAHRLLLSASSPYLKHVLQNVPAEQHSVLLLPHVLAKDFEHVLKFVYEGEIKISQKDLKSFLHVARLLGIKGMDFDDEETEDFLTDERNYTRHTFTNNDHSTTPSLRDNSSRPASLNTSDKSPPPPPEKEPSDHSEKSNQHSINITEKDEYYCGDDDKETPFLSGDEEDIGISGDNPMDRQSPDDESLLGDHPENDHDSLGGLPLLPEVSMEEDESFDLDKSSHTMPRHHLTQDMQVSSRSWALQPHSATSTSSRGHNFANPLKSIIKKGFSGGSVGHSEGILLRMMKEPLKSSMQTAAAQIHYDLDESGRRTKRYVQCTSCSKVLSSLSALKRHMEDVHCARIQGKCLICGRVYSSRNSLLTHVYSAHKKHHDYKAVARIIRESDFESFATSTS